MHLNMIGDLLEDFGNFAKSVRCSKIVYFLCQSRLREALMRSYFILMTIVSPVVFEQLCCKILVFAGLICFAHETLLSPLFLKVLSAIVCFFCIGPALIIVGIIFLVRHRRDHSA